MAPEAIDWGSVPEWIAGVATAGAFIFAAIVFWYDLRDRRKSDRQSQARRFDAWISDSEWKQHPASQAAATDPPVDLRVLVCIGNASTQAMRGVDAQVYFGKTPLSPIYSFKVCPPTTPEFPLKKECWFSPQPGLDSGGFPSEFLYGMLTMSLSFTDATGYHWHRTAEGQLLPR